jgi:hypothetical protein
MAATSADILVSHPTGARLGTLFPSSGYPLIRLALPTLIARNPHIVAAGRSIPPLALGPRWSNANHKIGSHGAERQDTRENDTGQEFAKHKSSSLSMFASARAVPSFATRTDIPSRWSGSGEEEYPVQPRVEPTVQERRGGSPMFPESAHCLMLHHGCAPGNSVASAGTTVMMPALARKRLILPAISSGRSCP